MAAVLQPGGGNFKSRDIIREQTCYNIAAKNASVVAQDYARANATFLGYKANFKPNQFQTKSISNQTDFKLYQFQTKPIS